MDLLFGSLVLVALGAATVAVKMFMPEKLPEVEAEYSEPEALVAGRGLAALRTNVFPRQHDTACSCNARALVWHKDPKRHDAWTGVCRRCGLVRLDVVAGEMLER